MNGYDTAAKQADAEIVEKKSRFIGYIKPVSTEADALEFLNQIRKKHWDATHNVYAYVIRENSISRFSDDGEPAKTAGAPVLDVIQKEGLTDVIVVVTRYFGGTLLGTGGLVKAYSKSAKAAMDAAGKAKRILCTAFFLNMSYPMWNKLEKELGNCVVQEIQYSSEVNVSLLTPSEEYDTLCRRLEDLSAGEVEPVIAGEEFAAFPERSFDKNK